MTNTTTIEDVIQLMRHGGLRVRTAVWCLPPAQLSDLPNQAARLNLGWKDARQPLLDQLAPTQKFLGLDAAKLINILAEFCQDPQQGDCLLVTNIDLLLARLRYHECVEVWRTLFNGFPHYPRALILVMPQQATTLLPSEKTIENWFREGRLIL
jgi:hypothetical protein